MPPPYTSQAIAQALQARLIGDANLLVSRVVHPAAAQNERDLVLAVDPKLVHLLAKTPARVGVVSSDAELEPGLLDACIVVDRPRLAMAKLSALFAIPVTVALGIHPSAVIEPGAKLGEKVRIGPFVYVGSEAEIGDECQLHPHAYVGQEAKLGAGTILNSGVRIGADVTLGERCLVHFNASIGADGFSFVTPEKGSVEQAKESGASETSARNSRLERIASLGAVEIGNDVEIGANTSIDRGTIASTKIGNGTKIDNQVQVGHNVIIGENCLICGRVGIAGSVEIGNRVVLGGATGVADHVKIGDDAIAMAMSAIAGNVPPHAVVGGIPAAPREKTMENLFNISRIKHLIKKVDALAERLDILQRKGPEVP
ncbi:MAG: UDP-3-O-(3-hydroxymyristoyl)glucosamine N-acyltransferase [Bdellovibrionales bacterium]